jgi:hypothetical protein
MLKNSLRQSTRKFVAIAFQKVDSHMKRQDRVNSLKY